MPKSAPKNIVKPTLNINLLHPQGSVQKLPVKFLNWLVSYGRYLTIVVEVVVVATFVMRFKLDAELSDLKTKINLQLPVIQSKAQDEAEIRHLQYKLTAINKAYSTTPDWNTILKDVSKELPSGVKLSNINLDHTDPSSGVDIKITGQAASSNDLEIFIAGLKQDKDIKNITLGSINLNQGEIDFAITGNY